MGKNPSFFSLFRYLCKNNIPMSKKIIITESQLKQSMSNLLIEELDKDDVVDMFKKNREFEKRVKEISAGVVSELFRILWQRRAFYDDIKR
jgi:hypothetical protein